MAEIRNAIVSAYENSRKPRSSRFALLQETQPRSRNPEFEERLSDNLPCRTIFEHCLSEGRLGVRFLNRTTRSVARTAAGRRLHERIEPRLGKFHRAHLEVVLDIVIDDGLSNIVSAGFDAGTRVGERLQKDMIAVRLTPDVKLMAVASLDYLDRHGEPKTLADLHRHACINWRFPGSGGIARWELEKNGKQIETVVEGPLISNHQDIVVPAALQGLGITYAHNDDGIAEALKRGQLKCILVGRSLSDPCLYFYYANRRHIQSALRAFIDCLLEREPEHHR